LCASAVADGGQVDTLVKEIKQRERCHTELQATLSALERATTEPMPDAAQLRQRIDAVLTDWRGLAAKHVQATRQLLRKLLVGRLTFTPQPAHGPGVIRFTGEGTLGPVVGMLPFRGVQGLVELRGLEPLTPRLPALCSPN
jgi:hypothetical protein